MVGTGFIFVFLGGVSDYIVGIPHLEKIAAGFYAFWLAYLAGSWWRER